MCSQFLVNREPLRSKSILREEESSTHGSQIFWSNNVGSVSFMEWKKTLIKAIRTTLLLLWLDR